jgi:hypothetical protein
MPAGASTQLKASASAGTKAGQHHHGRNAILQQRIAKLFVASLHIISDIPDRR